MQNFLNRNIKIFYLVNFLEQLVFSLPIWTFFFTTYHHFGLWNAIMINLVWGFSSFLFEIPSGAWADRFWRKNFYLFGLSLMILAFAIHIFATNIFIFIIASFLLWVWSAFISWNIEAILHDSLESIWQENEYSKIQANSSMFMFLWRAVSGVLGWIMYSINPLLPYVWNTLAYILALIVIFFLKESKQIKSSETSNFKQIKSWLKFIFWDRQILRIIILFAIICWIWNVYWFTYQEFLKDLWISITNIWLIFSVIAILSAFWSYLTKIMQKKFSINILYFIMIWFLLFESTLFATYSKLFWLIAIISSAISAWFLMPIWNSYLIKLSPKTHKSTILSIFSFAITVWYVSFSIVIWYLAEYFWLKNIYFSLVFVTIFVIVFDLIINKNVWNKKD